ncbi:MAG: protein phosphatase 2C domain-containing protein, partial [Rhodocyclaceae bacterium]|nr:protein phosphatase 2C domain-containing protein [Rhodocyclaceae bacterium]
MSATAPNTPLSLEIAARTDPGKLRSLNEDSIATVGELGLLVLSDGMGGYQSGDVASRITTQVIVEGLTQALKGKTQQDGGVAAVVEAVVKRANRAIFLEGESRLQREHTGREQAMGSTLALLLLKNNRVTLAHIGDSRIYRLRANRLELLTHDHSLLQEQIDQGILSAEAAAISHNRHLVTRGLGLQAEVDVALDACEALPGDLYLLCSDGLNDMVDNADIELVLNSLQANLPLAASQLVMIANDNGGEDNVSVILAKVGTQPFPAAKKHGFFGWLF